MGVVDSLNFELNWTTAVLCLVLPLSLLYLYGMNRKKKLPPGPYKWPLIGNTFDFVREDPYTSEYLLSLSKKYGPIVWLKMMSVNMIVITDYDILKEAFVKMSDQFGKRPDWMPMPKILFKDTGIVTSNGEKWKHSRKFTLLGLRDFGMGKKSIEYKIQEEVEALHESVRQYGEDSWDPKGILHNAVSNVVCNVIFGHRFAYSDTKFRDIIDASDFVMKNISNGNPMQNSMFLARLSPLVKQMGRKCDTILNVIDEEIENHRSTFDADNIRDFTDLFLQQESEANEQLSRDQIKGIIRDLFMAGTDTTSTSLQWGLLYMIENPEIQQKCQDEIDQVIGKSRAVAMTDKANLPYVEATLAELHRHASVAAVNVAHTTFEDVEFHGYHIPKKSFVIGCIYAIHMDPKYFGEDVEVFRPERWLKPDGSFVKNDHLIPFSIGTRSCIGEQLAKMELFLMFTSLLQRFSFEKRSPTEELDMRGVTGAVRVPKVFKLISKER